MATTPPLLALALLEEDARPDENSLAGGPMQEWNSTPAYPTPLVLLMTAFGIVLAMIGVVALIDVARTFRRGRGR